MSKSYDAQQLTASYRRGVSASPSLDRVASALWEAVTQEALSKDEFLKLLREVSYADFRRGVKRALMEDDSNEPLPEDTGAPSYSARWPWLPDSR